MLRAQLSDDEIKSIHPNIGFKAHSHLAIAEAKNFFDLYRLFFDRFLLVSSLLLSLPLSNRKFHH